MALLTMSSQLVGVLAAGVLDSDGDGSHLETGAWVARNSTQYNFLNHEDVELLEQKAEGCVDRGDCEQIKAEFLLVSDANRARLAACEVAGNCVAITAEIKAGQKAMDGLRGEASSIAEGTFRSRQIVDRIQGEQVFVSEGDRELSDYTEGSQREYAEGMLLLAQDPAAIEAWLEAKAVDGYLLDLGQQLVAAEADFSAMDGLSDEFLDLHAPGWRDYRDQMLISTGYVKDGAALIGDVLEPGLLDAIGPAGKAAHVMGVFAAMKKAGNAIPDQLLTIGTKLDELAAGKPPTGAELAPFRKSAEGRLREEVRQANLVVGGGDAIGPGQVITDVISPTYRELQGLNKGFQAHHTLPQYLGKMLGYTKNDMLGHPATLITQYTHTGKVNPDAMHKAISKYLPPMVGGKPAAYTSGQISSGLQKAYGDIGRPELFDSIKHLIK